MAYSPPKWRAELRYAPPHPLFNVFPNKFSGNLHQLQNPVAKADLYHESSGCHLQSRASLCVAAPLPDLSLPWCPTGTGFIRGLRVKAPCTEAASHHKHQWGSSWGHRRTRQEYPKFNASLGLVSKITKNKQPPPPKHQQE